MKAIIAEKPSVAREIAQILNVHERKEGYLTGNGYSITWALGHLVSLGMPEDYGVRGFDKASLPLFPDPFQLTPRKTKQSNSYKPDPSALKQLKVIQEVFDQCDSIIVATDAGREGELIFRYIYDYLKCTKPFERLWISSLTEKAITEGLKNLRPRSNFDNLYNAAKARSEADWLVGINASQALSIAAQNEVYSLGRVQTPTLALICRRFQDHNNFKKTKYWQIQLKHRKDYLDFTSLSEAHWEDQKQASQILKAIEREGRATIEDVSVKTVNESSPLLFVLTELQKEANRKLGLSANKVLQIAQSLYEKKFITYPRTGSKYIPEDLWTEIPELKIGNELKISNAELQEKTTTPPKLYTEADLLSAMENAGRKIENKDQQQILQRIGIGTPATRASIIETLLKRNYIIRKNKALVPTTKGLQVFELTKDKKISNAEMTAEWEIALDKIEKGKLNKNQFINDIQHYTTEITTELLLLHILQENIPQIKSPKCQNHNLIIKEKVVKCPDEQCKWILFRIICGVQLGIKDLTLLLTQNKTSFIKNMTSKNGKNFDAFITLKNGFNTSFEFESKN